MELTRRSFISLPTSSVVSAQNEGSLNRRNSSSSEEGGHGVLVDITKCTGCRACVVACKQWNHLQMSTIPDRGTNQDNPPGLDSNTFTTINTVEVEVDQPDQEFVYWKRQCMHCNEPACVGACIVGALRKHEDGPVIYIQNKCIGCRYCMSACPFGIPTYQWEKASPWIRKCTFCADRQAQNLQPACCGTCPSGALLFGNREDLIKEARDVRYKASPDKYATKNGTIHIYGEEEVGGTAWLYIAPASVSFEDLHFPQVGDEPAPKNARKAMGTLPYYAGGVILVMAGAYWYTKRRQKLAATKQEDKKEG